MIKKHCFALAIFIGCVGLLILSSVAIISYNYNNNVDNILKLSDSLMDQVTDTVVEKLIHFLEPVYRVVSISAKMAEQDVLSLYKNDEFEKYGLEILRFFPYLANVNFGDEKGNFMMLQRNPNGIINTKLINRNVKIPTVTWKYRNEYGELIKEKTTTETNFDPRTRSWYRGAKFHKSYYWTDVYVFFSSKKPGITIGHPIKGHDGKLLGVTSIDIELAEISNFLDQLQVSKNGKAFIIDEDNKLIAYPNLLQIMENQNIGTRDKEKIGDKDDGFLSEEGFRSIKVKDLGIGWVSASFDALKIQNKNKFIFEHQEDRYIASFSRLSNELGKNWRIGIIIPEKDIIGNMKRSNQLTIAISIVIMLLAVVVAYIVAHSISKKIRQKVQGQYDGIVRAFAEAINNKNKYTRFHSMGVTLCLEHLTKQLNIPMSKELRTAALLHDLGKLYIADHILEKPGRLNEEELKTMQSHPLLAGNVLKSIPGFKDVAEWVSMHHELNDGSGYPFGLIEDQIPFEAQLLCAADFIDALATNRPYRPRLPFHVIIDMVNKNAKRFRPEIHRAMKRLLNDRDFQKMYNLKGLDFKMRENIDEVRLRFVNERMNELIDSLKSARDIVVEIGSEGSYKPNTANEVLFLLEQFNDIYNDFSNELSGTLTKSMSYKDYMAMEETDEDEDLAAEG